MGGRGGRGGGEERTLGLFVQSFLPAFRGKQHRNTSHRSACEVWVDSDILEISVEMAVPWFLPRAIQLAFKLRYYPALCSKSGKNLPSGDDVGVKSGCKFCNCQLRRFSHKTAMLVIRAAILVTVSSPAISS